MLAVAIFLFDSLDRYLLYLLEKHNLHIKFVFCTSATGKKQIVRRYWSLGFIFALRLLGQMFDFVNVLLFQKSWRQFCDCKGAIFEIVFKNKRGTFSIFFGHSHQNG